MSLHPQPPCTGPLLFTFGCSPPSQALPACCCCSMSTRTSYFISVHFFFAFFFDSSSDVQEKIIKDNKDKSAYETGISSFGPPKCIPVENTTPVIESNWLLCSVTDCWLMTSRTVMSGTLLASLLGFWGSFLSTHSYPESPDGSITRAVLTCLAGLQASHSSHGISDLLSWRLVFHAVFRTFGFADPIYPQSLLKMFAFILTVIYNIQDTLQAPRDFDLGVLIYGVSMLKG